MKEPTWRFRLTLNSLFTAEKSDTWWWTNQQVHNVLCVHIDSWRTHLYMLFKDYTRQSNFQMKISGCDNTPALLCASIFPLRHWHHRLSWFGGTPCSPQCCQEARWTLFFFETFHFMTHSFQSQCNWKDAAYWYPMTKPPTTCGPPPTRHPPLALCLTPSLLSSAAFWRQVKPHLGWCNSTLVRQQTNALFSSRENLFVFFSANIYIIRRHIQPTCADQHTSTGWDDKRQETWDRRRKYPDWLCSVVSIANWCEDT